MPDMLAFSNDRKGLLLRLSAAETKLNQIILGKPNQIRLALAALLAGGHLLLEDLPGMGKTTLAQSLCAIFSLHYSRVQFTSDLLPSDLLGVSILQREHNRFTFQPGPIFAQMLLADELNRGTPKTQSALLEAMAEGQVTTEGETRPLPKPFFVIATQNPQEQVGTFPLPESQLDRFLLSLSLGYPDQAAERKLLTSNDRRDLIRNTEATLNAEDLLTIQQFVSAQTVSETLIDYVQRLLAASRSHNAIATGLSPRAGLALLQASRAMALLRGRDFCLPEDVQAVFNAISAHRLVLNSNASASASQVATDVLESTRAM
jgi:MoxR-like ATPase